MDGAKLGVDFVKTLYRIAAATGVAAVVAIPLGIVLGSAEKLYRSLEFVIDFFRSTPASAMFPLFLVLFGVGDETKISVAAFGAGPAVQEYCASPLPNDQFSLATSNRLMKTSCGRNPGLLPSRSTMRR